MAARRHEDGPWFHPLTVEEWAGWLAEHHDDTEPGVWMVMWRRAGGREPLPYEEVIEATLAVGWIDGTKRTIDDERSMMWFTRRRPRSQWTRLSKERVARVEAAGRMTDAGRAVIDRARADGSWSMLDGAEALEVPADLAAAFAEHPPTAGRPGAAARWDELRPGARRVALAWIATARRPETRARIAETAALAAQGVAARS